VVEIGDPVAAQCDIGAVFHGIEDKGIMTQSACLGIFACTAKQ
jgi:hypothetical protein